MRKFLVMSACGLTLCNLVAHTVAAEEKRFNAGASIQEMHDSNFTQSLVEESEKIKFSSVSVGFHEILSRQKFLAGWKLSHYQHDLYSDFDATFHEGKFNWKGELANQFNTEFEASRNVRLAERIEFFDKDIVNRDAGKIKLGYGNDGNLSLHISTLKTKQTHSNILREPLNYDENENAIDTGYQTDNKSTLILKYKAGRRNYLTETINENDLDFNYRQVELESTWVISPKTNATATLAHVERDGSTNNASGALMSLEIQWELSPKVQLQGGYSFRQPAVGETSDSPIEERAYSISAIWQFSSKLSFSSNVSLRDQHYENSSVELTRTENFYHVSPLAITYAPLNSITVVLDFDWRKNKSPISYRKYSSLQSLVCIRFTY